MASNSFSTPDFLILDLVMAILPRSQRLALAAQAAARPVSVPAPITGWNARDALDEMPATDAVLLDNWYPDYSGCAVRNGFVLYASGVNSSPVRTLAEYNAGAIRHSLRGWG